MSDTNTPALDPARAAWRRAFYAGYKAATRDHFELRISRGAIRRFLGSALRDWRNGEGIDAPPRLSRILGEGRAAAKQARGGER